MLQINNLSKSYGGHTLFDGVGLQLGNGERLGLVGRNGHGKSTLLRLILGEEAPDSGTISVPRNYRIGHLAQNLVFTAAAVLDEACLGLPPDERDDRYKAEAILFGLGFTKADMTRPPADFSGGYQIRLNLAKVLLSGANLLLLDEPTNYLDIVSMRWLTRFLRAWRDELILISHDRDFMDAVTTHTAAIHRGRLRKVKGATAKLYEQIAQEEEIDEKTRINEEKRRTEIETFVNRFRAQANKAALVQSRVKLLEKMPEREALSDIATLEFDFTYAQTHAKTVMSLDGVSFHYTPDVPLIQQLSFPVHARDRIAIIGKNGIGKSTLLALMAGERAPVSGDIQRSPHLRSGYFGQTNIERLHPKATVEEEIGSANRALSRTQVRGLCGAMMFDGDKAEKRVSVLSGGEKSRVLLGKILATPSNLLLLDEPTHHLDMQSIEALMQSIERFPGAVVIVTHSERILRKIATKLIVFARGGVEPFLGTYDDFLDKIGWEDEGTTRPSRAATAAAKPARSCVEQPPPKDKDALRKRRVTIVSERSQTLAPLKKEMARLERVVIHLEGEQKKVNAALVAASEARDGKKIAELSRESSALAVQVDANFEKLAEVTRDHDEKAKTYEAQLAALEM